MEFIVREVLTKEDLLHYHRQVYQKKPGTPSKRRLSVRGMRLVFLLVMAGGAALLALQIVGPAGRSFTPWRWMDWLYGGVLFLVGGIGLYRWRNGQPCPRWVERVWRKAQGMDRGIYRFQEEGFFVLPRCGNTIQPYESLTHVWEDEGYFYLVQEKVQFFLCKRNFIRGNPVEFAAFLGEKTGRPVLPVTPER